MVPEIETERLRLRGHALCDFDACAAMWAEPAVVRHIGGKAGDLLNGGGITGASDLKRAFDAFKPDALKSDFGDLQKAFSITPGGIYH